MGLPNKKMVDGIISTYAHTEAEHWNTEYDKKFDIARFFDTAFELRELLKPLYTCTNAEFVEIINRIARELSAE